MARKLIKDMRQLKKAYKETAIFDICVALRCLRILKHKRIIDDYKHEIILKIADRLIRRLPSTSAYQLIEDIWVFYNNTFHYCSIVEEKIDIFAQILYKSSLCYVVNILEDYLEILRPNTFFIKRVHTLYWELSSKGPTLKNEFLMFHLGKIVEGKDNSFNKKLQKRKVEQQEIRTRNAGFGEY